MNSSNTDKDIEQHGGNLSWIDAHYPDAPRPFINLSTSINPYHYPLPAIDPEWNYQLPGSAVMDKAYKAAAEYYGAEHVALASGMQPLMMALASLRMKEYGVSRIGILSPTYGEHQLVWKNIGHYCFSFDDIAQCNYDVVVLCNPNNPDGHVIEPENLLALATYLMSREGWLVVDESFMDLAPGQSISSLVKDHPNVVVLRSCGKFFGVPGMRLSAAIGPETCVEWLRMIAGPWPISAQAAHLLPPMLADKAWRDDMRVKLAPEAQSWRARLEKHFCLVGHTDLFTLVEIANAADWFHHFAQRGILVRRFHYDNRWLRFGLPPAAHLDRINAALKSMS